MSQALVGQRIRRLRHVAGFGQAEFAKMVGIASGSVSKLENGRMPITDDLLSTIAAILGCTPRFLTMTVELAPTTRPWLRAYADAPKRTVDQIVDECTTAMEAIVGLELKLLPDSLPHFTGDLMDPSAIEDLAADVRVAAGLDEGDVVGNSIRAAERLGCVVLPMSDEVGRHIGLSVRANLTGVICLGRWTAEGSPVPGDRQRWTVAHELGHLTLHAGLGAPDTADEASRIEKQAHAFAGAFLAPGDAMLDELQRLGGRVTLQTLARIKENWGVSIKALVTRFRTLGVIDAEHARSLFKQISARGWNKSEPVPVGNEQAIWFQRALDTGMRGSPDPVAKAADTIGLDRRYFDRWTDWSTPQAVEIAEVITPDFGSRPARESSSTGGMAVSLLTHRRNQPRRTT
ncbi:XRE family transcriptional regulator [Actinokineospora sp. NBRC 105648]|uniref:XRE family transcriptional regulator n=1 Tax=Actinokineospora sp. NBRC 105648 TaxID=3032206 RepID=UPI00255266DD|nr:XRE family transcriptional regulator [Actinokineospora sp. NBRC 105648]